MAQYPHKIRSVKVEAPKHLGSSPEHPQAEAGEQPEKQSAAPQEPQLPVLDLTVDHGLTDDQIRIVKTLEGRTMQVDDIIDETQIPTRQVLSALTMLEIDQIVIQSSGKRFSLAVTLA